MRQDMPSCLLNRFGITRSVEFVAKLRWFRNSFWKAKSEEHLQLRRGLSTYLEFNGITPFVQRFSGLTERSRSCFSGWKEKSVVPNVQKLSGRVDGVQQHIRGARYNMLFGRSLRITFLLLLSIILIGDAIPLPLDMTEPVTRMATEEVIFWMYKKSHKN
ncbi:hypothetical protein ACMD2_25161 [Ananas comosus]|uniref:Uncharacterized protein n=1 Tax=Ananas comosus TaxID=4615 RepID=A0A199VC14_ANACO|nr:hypothetical protein ACMD2_25161 [Ananas comosus]